MAEFLKAYNRTSAYEGGYANVKNDAGGITYAGIARNFWPSWKGWAIVDRNKPLRHNQKIKSSELEGYVKQFYYQNFWNKIQGDGIDSQSVAEFLYDYYVHSGARAVRKLQEILGVRADGILGNITLTALNKSCSPALLKKLVAERRQFLYDLSEKASQRKFRAGWLARVDGFKTL